MSSFLSGACLVSAHLPSLGPSSPAARAQDRPFRRGLCVNLSNFPGFPSVSWQHGQSTVWNTLCSPWVIDAFCLPHLCGKLHAWPLCFHCLSHPTLAPSLYSILYTPITLNSFLFLESSMVSLPSPSQIWPIKFHCLESFSHFFSIVTHCLAPLPSLANSLPIF